VVATLIGLIGGLAVAQTQYQELQLHFNNDALTIGLIFGNNLRVVVASVLLGIFSFGVLPLVVPLVNSAVIAFVIARVASSGQDPLLILVSGILPHGVFEIFAVWLASILALRLGAAVIARQPRMTLGDHWLLALADYMKAFIFVVLPLLILAALIEVNITPVLLKAALGQ
jgi:stage II sporulation protein M